MSKNYPIGVVPLTPEEGGGYLGIVADLPGCMSHGDTPEEALAGAQAAVLEWLDEAKELKIDIPEPGSAGARMRTERTTLLAQLNSQKQAFEKLEGEVKILRANVQAILDETNDPDDRQLTWMTTAVFALGKRRAHNVQ